MSATSITLIVTVVSSPVWVPLFEFARNRLWARINFRGWQAVFMDDPRGTNTYFGHIKSISKNDLVLEDIYYLSQDVTPESIGELKEPKLIKLGEGQLHNPQDKMIINRQYVSFLENMKEDAPVVVAILKHRDKSRAK